MQRIIHTILTIAGLGLVAVYALACTAPFVSPARSHVIALLGMSMPILFVIMSILCVATWLTRTWKIAILLTLTIICSYPAWRKSISFHLPQNSDAITTPPLTIITYNIHGSAGLSNIDSISSYIRSTNADIVCLQEFAVQTTGKYREEYVLDALSDLYPYHHVWYPTQTRWNRSGNITLSRHPIVNTDSISYKGAGTSMYCDLIFNNDTIRVINNYLEPTHLDTADRKYVTAIIDEDFDERKFAKSTLTIKSKLGSSMKTRSQQALAIRKVIDGSRYPTIVVGDFNDVTQSYTYRTIARDMTNAYADAGPLGYFWTFREHKMLFAIDHILLSGHFQAIKATIDRIRWSDHYPVRATFALK